MRFLFIMVLGACLRLSTAGFFVSLPLKYGISALQICSVWLPAQLELSFYSSINPPLGFFFGSRAEMLLGTVWNCAELALWWIERMPALFPVSACSVCSVDSRFCCIPHGITRAHTRSYTTACSFWLKPFSCATVGSKHEGQSTPEHGGHVFCSDRVGHGHSQQAGTGRSPSAQLPCSAGGKRHQKHAKLLIKHSKMLTWWTRIYRSFVLCYWAVL